MIDPRWRTVLTVTPYLVLGMLVVFTAGVQWGDWARLGPTLLLCAAAGALIVVLRDIPSPWRGRTATAAVLMTGLVAINLVLVLRESWFGFLTVGTFTLAYTIVPWPWRLASVGATAVVSGLAQSSDVGRDAAGIAATIAIVALNVVVMCGLAWGLLLAQRQQERAATEGERARLAREIHDTLAQGFAGIVTQLQAAADAPDESARTRHTDAALALARDGLAEARRSVRALRPPALDEARLPEALATMARSWSARTGIPADVSITGAARTLPLATEVALLRTAQEALANVERHAGAHRVALALRSDAAGARLEVRDDGRGFDPSGRPLSAAHPDGGYGLVAMRERLASVAGELVVESNPGHGTAVRAVVPT